LIYLGAAVLRLGYNTI